jgi:hypothetical protein
MTYYPLFISEEIPSNSHITIPKCELEVEDILRLFHLHYKNALLFYSQSFFENTHKTFGCLALSPMSSSYSFMKNYDFTTIQLEEDYIYIKEGAMLRLNDFRNFYCSYPTFLKLTSSYKYFIDYSTNFNYEYKSKVFTHYIMKYILSANLKVKILYE